MEGDQYDKEESGDEGVLDGRKEDSNGDDEELEEDLDAGPSEEAGQRDGRNVLGVRGQEISPPEVESRPLAVPPQVHSAAAVVVLLQPVSALRCHAEEGPPRLGIPLWPSLEKDTKGRRIAVHRNADLAGDGKKARGKE